MGGGAFCDVGFYGAESDADGVGGGGVFTKDGGAAVFAEVFGLVGG